MAGSGSSGLDTPSSSSTWARSTSTPEGEDLPILLLRPEKRINRLIRHEHLTSSGGCLDSGPMRTRTDSFLDPKPSLERERHSTEVALALLAQQIWDPILGL